MTTFAKLYSEDDIRHGVFAMDSGGFTFNGVVLSDDDLVGLMERSPAFRIRLDGIATAMKNFRESGVDLKPGELLTIGGLCFRKVA